MRPTREHATNNGQTYLITSSTWERRTLFSNECWARLLIDTFYRYRGSAYLLHEFVVMPDHIHLVLTPNTSLEKAVQFIKGGFSYRIRDASDYRLYQIYVHQNPVRKGLCARAEEYPYSSAHGAFELDRAPQRLKPEASGQHFTARLEGAPFQSKRASHIDVPQLVANKEKTAS